LSSSFEFVEDTPISSSADLPSSPSFDGTPFLLDDAPSAGSELDPAANEKPELLEAPEPVAEIQVIERLHRRCQFILQNYYGFMPVFNYNLKRLLFPYKL
jgi:hypothetical protein